MKDLYQTALAADVLLYLNDAGGLAYKAPPGGVPDELRRRILEHKAALIEFLRTDRAPPVDAAAGSAPIVRVAERTRPLVSRAQQRVWFAEQQSGDGSQFNIQGCFAFDGALDAAHFAAAVADLVRRHEVLRTAYFERDGELRAELRESAPAPFVSVDLTAETPAVQTERVKARIRADLHTRFDLARDALLRVTLLRLSAERHVAVFNVHHIAADGWSVGLLIEDFCRAYRARATGEAVCAAPAPLQYADFAAWQAAHADTAALERGLAFWRDCLDGVPEAHSLPLDKPRPAQQTFAGASLSVATGADLAQAIRTFCRERKATLFMLLETALSLTLSFYGGEKDIVLGTPVAGRSPVETEAMVGLFLNTVALRNRIDPALSFDQLLQANKANILAAFGQQHVPLERVVQQLGHRRSASYSPLFQIWFVLQNNRAVELELPGCRVRDYTDLPPPAAKYDLNVYATEADGEIRLEWIYNTDLFERSSIAYVAQQFLRLLAAVIAAPHRACAEHVIFPAQHLYAPVEAVPPAVAEIAAADGVVRRIAQQIARHGAAPAVICDQGKFDYRALDALAARYAAALGRGTGAPVGLLMRRGVHIVAAMLAALRLRRPYVTLDPDYPPARLRYMLEHAGCDTLVCAAAERELAHELGAGLRVIDAPAATAAAVDAVVAASAPDAPAYILYTSGSTGQPKGVFQSHAGLGYHAAGYMHALGLTPQDRVLQLASYGFDASVLDTYGALLAGAGVHLADPKTLSRERLLGAIETQGITVYHSTPTVFKYLFADAPASAAARIRAVVLGGEAVDAQTTAVFRRVFGADCRLLGLYGATESSLVTLCDIAREDIDARRRPTLGRPVAGTDIRVRRDDGTLARVFELGQIAIRSAFTAGGYWRDAELTRQKFLPADAGSVEYLSGDTGYVLPDGRVRFVGRADFQTKLNGIRIELGEIESVLRRLDEVRQAVALIRDAEGEHAQLVAYVVSSAVAAEDAPQRAESERLAAERCREHLGRWLPAYMLPHTFVWLDQLPQTPSGKVDRRRLPAPPSATAAAERIAPRDELEHRLCELWAQNLGVDAIGVQDDFFRLGGHSLKAMRLLAAIEQACGVEISLQAFFAQPTVAGCAAAIRSGRDAPVRSELPRVEPDTTNRHAPFPLTLIQQAYWLGRNDLFGQGAASTQSYIEANVRDLDVDRLCAAFNALIARHDMLRAVIDESGEQRILAQVPRYDIALLDLRAQSESDIAAASARLRAEMSTQTLRIDTWPIFDLRVCLLPGGAGRVHIVTDAITLDARSRSVLARELAALYADPARVLPPLGLSFRDYVLAEHALRDTPAYAAAKRYWLERVDDLPGAPDLPQLAQAPAAAVCARRWYLPLAATQWSALKAKAAQARLTPANLVLTAFGEVLALWSKSARFCLNLTLFNRQRVHPQVDDIVGDFTSSLLLEIDMHAEATFARQAERIRDQLWNDIAHRAFGGVEVLRELNSRRSRVSAQMPIVFTSTLGLADDAPAAESPFVLSDAAGTSRTSQVSLDCQLVERDGGAAVLWDGVETQFPPDLLEAMFGAFRARVLELADPAQTELPQARLALPAAQKARRDAVNATGSARPQLLLHRLFDAPARTHAHKHAVVWRDGALSYAELDRLSNALAHELRARGVRVNELVAVVARKGWEQVLAVFAILKAGAAYLPIDPDLPAQRRAQLFEQAEVRLALTQAELADTLEWPPQVAHSVLDRAALARGDTRALADVQCETDLAYVIFTSGSTGVPKGVMIDHRGAVNTILDINRRFGVTERDAVLALSALNFDLSVYDIFGLLAVGGTIVFPEPGDERDPLEWTRLVEAHGVTVWNTVPALAQMWIDALEDRAAPLAASLRVVMMSGDWIPTGLPNRIRACLPSAEIYSLGGATEASIWSIVYPIGEVDARWSSIPYGKPMENQTFHVLKPDFRACPDWVPGDLYIGGIGLAQGYWKDAAKTNAAFVTCPLSGERLYKTGDLGRYLPDGNIEFLGREDSQVKVNGYRIELGDIEAALLKHPHVKLAIAAAVGERNRKQLVAYVMLQDALRDELRAKPAALAALSAEVQERIRAQLPSYMVPAAFVLLEAVPLTANGKVDRNALPVPELARGGATPYRAPANDAERALCEIWQQLLKLERVGADANFFELGGDSLLASRAVGLIRARFGLGDRLKIRRFFEAPTVAAVAAHVTLLLDRISLADTLRSLSGSEQEVEEGMI